jgi:hypothetical protein
MKPAARIYLLFLAFMVAFGSAFVIPRFAAGGSNGFASGASAAVAFLGLMLVALIIAIVLLVVSFRHRSSLGAGAKIAGFAPLPIVAAGAIVVVLLIRQKEEERRQDQLPPAKLTPTAPP